MAKSKASRKGKKQWRKNISSEEHTNFLENESKIERSGGHLQETPDSKIFFVDKKQDISVVRKVDRYRSKTLHVDKVLKRNSLVPAVSWPSRSKAPAGGLAFLPPAAKSKPSIKRTNPPSDPVTMDSDLASSELDLWSKEPWGDETAGKVAKGVKQLLAAPKTEKRHIMAPAVEVDMPGCSFNPSFEDHQDALGVAVGQIIQKDLLKELEPEAPALILTGSDALNLMEISEEDKYFLEVGNEEDANDEEAEAEGDENELAPAISKKVEVKRLTRADLNRKLRRRAAEAEMKEKAKKKKQRVAIERLQDIAADVEEEEEEKEKRRLRRDVARVEKRASIPARLGPHKFKPDSVKVLMTEDVSGSLRKLKGCSTLAMDRFKSFQRRGLVEPRVPVKRKQAKNRRVVQQGTKGKLEREMHQEILLMRAARLQSNID